MIFGTGLFLFLLAFGLSALKRPEKAGGALSTAGLFGVVLMLASLCMLVARFMP